MKRLKRKRKKVTMEVGIRKSEDGDGEDTKRTRAVGVEVRQGWRERGWW
jgi:hypothetical protein